ncbi:SigE family RNA polymerase sigma factor [Streptomyces sp. NPDC059506]|uniref:SigE family RNA polymerase sigma factor n=1 Tax=Streptomyces sp. NPDC059506 TaxID=3347751 RepID=UPI003675DA8E
MGDDRGRTVAGHSDGYEEFAASRAGHLFRSACLLTSGDTHLAEDLVQETLGRMYAVWGRATRVDNPAGYAQTVLVRVFLAHRRRRSSGERPAALLPVASGRRAAGTPGTGTAEAAGTQDDAALRLDLLGALARLPAKDRAVLVLRYWEDRSVEETAEAMRVSPTAVRVRSSRALAKVRELLGGSITEFAGR